MWWSFGVQLSGADSEDKVVHDYNLPWKEKQNQTKLSFWVFDGISDTDVIDAAYEIPAGTYKQEFRLCQVQEKGFNPQKNKEKENYKQTSLKKGRENEETAMNRLYTYSRWFSISIALFLLIAKKLTGTSID